MAKKKKTTKKGNKNRKNVNNRREVLSSSEYGNSTSNVLKCIIAVVLIFLLTYLLTVYITKKSVADYITKDDSKTAIQYSEILSGQSFNKKDDEYLVLFYDVDEDRIYTSFISDYEAKDEHTAIYYVDLGNRMNKNCISNDSNKEATNSSELRINGPTLIKFTNNEISDYIEGEDAIKEYLK